MEESSTTPRYRRESIYPPEVWVTVTSPDSRQVHQQLKWSRALLVGKSAECDIVVPDSRVSSQHCELRLREDDRKVVILDLGSKNGTIIRNIPIMEAVLEPGEWVTIGSSTLVVTQSHEAPEVILSDKSRFGDAVGESNVMRSLFAQLEAIVNGPQDILFIGDPGTGKSLLARAVHDASLRCNRPFIPLNCDTVRPHSLDIEQCSFVPEQYSSTVLACKMQFDQSREGTLLLRYIDQMPRDAQSWLLGVLSSMQSDPSRPRIMATTRQDLDKCVKNGLFDATLHEHIRGFSHIDVPQLKQRRGDIRLLVDHFLSQLDPPCTSQALPSHCRDLLQANHAWPGNVTELLAVVGEMVSRSYLVEDTIDTALEETERDFLLNLEWKDARQVASEVFEIWYIKQQLKRYPNVKATANAIHLARQNLHESMKKYGIRREDRVTRTRRPKK